MNKKQFENAVDLALRNELTYVALCYNWVVATACNESCPDCTDDDIAKVALEVYLRQRKSENNRE